MLTDRQWIRGELDDIPLYDAHTHIDSGHPGARGLQDILLYHMVISDLRSAGCSRGDRLSESPGEEEVRERIGGALPYWPHIAGTSCAWGVRTILGDLYGWQEPILPDNWMALHDRIRERAGDPAWYREILARAGIVRYSTEWARRGPDDPGDLVRYSLEWAFFTRSQWGRYDTALLELEWAWSQGQPGLPLPVTLAGEEPALSRHIRTTEDVREAILHYCDRIPYEQIVSMASHLSTDLDYGPVDDRSMTAALARRDRAGPEERNIYACYVFEHFLDEYERRGAGPVLQFSIGAEPLPYETGSKLRTETLYQLVPIFARHPGIHFQLFLASAHQNQALCTLARELPNVSVAGYWWHNFFPSFIRRVMEERLDMLASNRQVGFFSDAYCVEWAYAKARIVRAQLADVLSDQVAQGRFGRGEAVSIARRILYETPLALFG